MYRECMHSYNDVTHARVGKHYSQQTNTHTQQLFLLLIKIKSLNKKSTLSAGITY